MRPSLGFAAPWHRPGSARYMSAELASTARPPAALDFLARVPPSGMALRDVPSANRPNGGDNRQGSADRCVTPGCDQRQIAASRTRWPASANGLALPGASCATGGYTVPLKAIVACGLAGGLRLSSGSGRHGQCQHGARTSTWVPSEGLLRGLHLKHVFWVDWTALAAPCEPTLKHPISPTRAHP